MAMVGNTWQVQDGHLFDATLSSTDGANLRALANVHGINSISSSVNGLLKGTMSGTSEDQAAVKRSRVVEFFYDKMLLDTIKLGTENNVYLKYCETKEVPQGHSKLLLRRWGGLTEHTVPLAEGIPPKSDHMASESFSGTFNSYGRYMEFTNRVDFMLIDDVIAHYTMEYGDVAVRTAERLCREEMLAVPNETFANGGTFDELVIGDTVGIEDYRLQSLKFQRRLVKPINGSFIVLTSPEHLYDLVSDPLVEKYMTLTNTADPLKTGKPVELFGLKFETTMLDDYAYGYTEMSNPGEYKDGDNYKLRVVAKLADGSYAYANVSDATTAVAAGSLAIKRTVADKILKDGSYIPNKVTWELAKVSFAADTSYTFFKDEKGAAKTVKGSDIIGLYQLPVHHAFMFGKEFMVKTGISGRTGAKFYVKAKGSAGVLDPIDQRQSIGFKIDTLGFNCLRPEAIVRFTFVPQHALETYEEVIEAWDNSYKGNNSYSIVKNEQAPAE